MVRSISYSHLLPSPFRPFPSSLPRLPPHLPFSHLRTAKEMPLGPFTCFKITVQKGSRKSFLESRHFVGKALTYFSSALFGHPILCLYVRMRTAVLHLAPSGKKDMQDEYSPPSPVPLSSFLSPFLPLWIYHKSPPCYASLLCRDREKKRS